MLKLKKEDNLGYVFFMAGLILGAGVFYYVSPGSFAFEIQRTPTTMAFAGLLVGFGVKISSGCTSGHGVCGIGRLSLRSITATVTFITTGIISVWIINHFFAGVL